MLAAVPPRTLSPSGYPAGFPLTVASASYDPALRSLISAYKERAALGLAAYLGLRLAVAVAFLLQLTGVGAGPLLLVPVPSARAASRRRGLDATATLARHAARRLRWAGRPTCVRGLLTAVRRVADQAGLSAAERQLNLRGAWRVRAPVDLRLWTVVVVDDIVTTGASLREATDALRRTGCEPLGAATVAFTPRRRPG